MDRYRHEVCFNIPYSINGNGNQGDVFQPTRGLRQKDPLIHFLFLICSERLLTLMNLNFHEGLLKGARTSRQGPQILYLLFVDDCVIFGNTIVKGAQIIKKILKVSKSYLGQCVNFEKSTAFFSSNIKASLRVQVARMLRVHHSSNSKK